MKKQILMTCLAGAAMMGTASAGDLHAEGLLSAESSIVSQEDMRQLSLCLNSDTQAVSSRSIRACSKAIRASVPSYDLRSDLYARRGLLQLSAGRFEKASRDFGSAARLNGEHEFAYLGQGFAAVMQQDPVSAETYFNDCKGHAATAPLASYGLAMTYELKGDKESAMREYERAAKLRPDWQAPKTEITRLARTL